MLCTAGGGRYLHHSEVRTWKKLDLKKKRKNLFSCATSRKKTEKNRCCSVSRGGGRGVRGEKAKKVFKQEKPKKPEASEASKKKKLSKDRRQAHIQPIRKGNTHSSWAKESCGKKNSTRTHGTGVLIRSEGEEATSQSSQDKIANQLPTPKHVFTTLEKKEHNHQRGRHSLIQ